MNTHALLFAYHWLEPVRFVVADARAQYKGSGTINGTGKFGFILTVIDAQLTPSTDVDLFRIKIWSMANGNGLVYDNKMGGGDNDDPTTAIGGGAIMIHKK